MRVEVTGENAYCYTNSREIETDKPTVVFIHGFSASPGELSPMPQMIALNLRANLFLTRLTGHGQDGAAFGASTYEAWQKDANEAFEIGAAIGERVIVMA